MRPCVAYVLGHAVWRLPERAPLNRVQALNETSLTNILLVRKIRIHYIYRSVIAVFPQFGRLSHIFFYQYVCSMCVSKYCILFVGFIYFNN